jgi:hypothetical protein
MGKGRQHDRCICSATATVEDLGFNVGKLTPGLNVAQYGTILLLCACMTVNFMVVKFSSLLVLH